MADVPNGSPAPTRPIRNLSVDIDHFVGSDSLHEDPADDMMTPTFTEGRPPWFTKDGKLDEPMMIGVSGGTASGKTTVCRTIIETLQLQWVVVLSLDSFYLTIPHDVDAADYDFDSPNAFDVEEIVRCLHELKAGRSVDIPVYDFVTHSRVGSKRVYGADVIIMEGLLIFYWPELRELFDLRVFVDTDSDIRLARRIRRDVAERGRTVESVLNQYEKTVKPAFDNYIEPTRRYANVVLPYAEHNIVGVQLLVQYIETQLKSRGFVFRNRADQMTADETPENVTVLRMTDEIKAIHTKIRDINVDPDDFTFYADRLARLLVEEGLALLPAKETTVTTPTGADYVGLIFDYSRVCGVSVMRAGEAFEPALRDCVQDVAIGKLLIQSKSNNEPRLFYHKLPSNIAEMDCVMLLEPLICTGSTALMAIRVLLDHGVAESAVVLVSMIAAPPALSAIAYAYPQVRVVVSEIDPVVEERDGRFVIIPGIGSYGNKHFGTEGY